MQLNPAELCKVLEDSLAVGSLEQRLRLAEIEAGWAQHHLNGADPDIAPEHLKLLGDRCGHAAARVRRLKSEIEHLNQGDLN